MAELGTLVVHINPQFSAAKARAAKAGHADDLYQVLSDLTSMARLGVPICCINTYLAAIRNAEQLLEKIDQESTEDADDEKQTD